MVVSSEVEVLVPPVVDAVASPDESAVTPGVVEPLEHPAANSSTVAIAAHRDPTAAVLVILIFIFTTSFCSMSTLLGHRNMRMTLVDARISDRTVADGYFRVTEAVEAVEANYHYARLMPSSCSFWPSHARIAVY